MTAMDGTPCDPAVVGYPLALPPLKAPVGLGSILLSARLLCNLGQVVVRVGFSKPAAIGRRPDSVPQGLYSVISASAPAPGISRLLV
jgi:hypothetical protein